MLFTPKTASSSSPLLRQLVSGLALLSILGTRVVASQPLDGGDYEDNIDFIINNSGDENNDDEVVGNDGEGGVDEEGDERFGQCTDAVATWVSVNKKCKIV